MRDPKIVLKQLSSLKKNQRVTNIYCNLYNPEFYKLAYCNISTKSNIDGLSEDMINNLISSLRNYTYRPTPLNKINITKDGKPRNVCVPSLEDKLVQEIIKMILESLWEPHFLDCSHGFRPKRSCHTALKYATQKFTGTKWWIVSDIKSCFENINHEILLNILKERIREQKFLHLINLFLKSGYIENWKYHRTYSGVLLGNIISPILANIYLDKLDYFMMDLKTSFDVGKSRKRTHEYRIAESKVYHLKKNIKDGIKIDESRKKYQVEYKNFKKKFRKIGAYDYYDPNFKRLNYVRYADDFIVGIVSSRKEADEIRKKVVEFLNSTLKLSVNDDKTSIVNNQDKIKFLGYELSVMRSDTRASVNGKIGLWLPYEVMKNFIIDNRFGKFVQDDKTGKPKFKALALPKLVNLEEMEILFIYNTRIRGLYNYYKLASNVCKMVDFNFICQTSFLKTICLKYKTSRAKLYANKHYNHRSNNGSHIGITYKDKFYEFFNGPFKVCKVVKYEPNIDFIELIEKYFSRTSLIERMEAHVCEVCGNTTGPFEVHHVKKLKDLKGKSHWEKLMIARKRKTLVLCVKCHDKLHAGKL